MAPIAIIDIKEKPGESDFAQGFSFLFILVV